MSIATILILSLLTEGPADGVGMWSSSAGFVIGATAVAVVSMLLYAGEYKCVPANNCPALACVFPGVLWDASLCGYVCCSTPQPHVITESAGLCGAGRVKSALIPLCPFLLLLRLCLCVRVPARAASRAAAARRRRKHEEAAAAAATPVPALVENPMRRARGAAGGGGGFGGGGGGKPTVAGAR